MFTIPFCSTSVLCDALVLWYQLCETQVSKHGRQTKLSQSNVTHILCQLRHISDLQMNGRMNMKEE